MVQAVFVVVGLVVLGAFVALAVQYRRLSAQVRRLERNATPAEVLARLAAVELVQTRLAFEVQTQARLAAAAQAHSVTELRALRDEFTTARVEQSAATVGARRAEKRAEAATLSAGSTDAPDAADEPRDTLATPPPVGPVPKLANDDGEPTTVLDPEPPRYARHATIRPSAPLAHPDLIGSEDIAEEAARPRLGPEDETPPRRGRASLRLPAYADEKAGGAS